MAYKNKNKNKAHISELKKIGWRKENQKRAQIRRGISEQKQIENIMRMQGLL